MVEREFHAWPKNQAMGSPTEMKHSDLIALPNMLSFVSNNLARRHLGHPHAEEAHQSDIRIIRFDKDKGPCRHRRDVSLRIIRTGRIKPLRRCLRIVGPVFHVRLCNPATYRTVPAVVTEGAQIGLVDCPVDEERCQIVVRKHVCDRIWLGFDPKFVA